MKKKVLSSILAMGLALSCFAGCGAKNDAPAAESKQEAAEETAKSETEKEDKAEPEAKADGDLTVVSLAPSVTEILFAIGAGDEVVGRTDYCNFPAEAASVESIGTYSAPNMELIVSKSPDLVIASDFIDENIQKQLEDCGAEVYVVHASDVNEIENEILTIGEKTGHKDGAETVVEGMKATSKEIEDKAAGIEKEKSVFFDLGSYYTAGPGSFLNNVLTDIHVINIAADTGEAWPQLSVENIVSANPDVYISTFTPADELRAVSGFASLECMKDENLKVLDADLADRVQRAGPRIVDAEKELMELIYGK